MTAIEHTLEALIVQPGSAARLDRRDPAWDRGVHGDHRAEAATALAKSVEQLEAAHELLWASGTHGLLIVVQAMDAAGKDGTIRHVMSGVNPTGVEVVSFKQPSAEELGHDFLWRAARALPARGRVAIFNRSHYEEVLSVRVHPDWLERQHLPPGPRGKAFWEQRYQSINAFERHADADGIKIVKLFLNVSRDEQRKRLLARLDDPEKEWKFSVADLAERAHWDEYMQAYEDAITATSTAAAPWYVIPADRKPLMRALAAGVIVEAISSLGLRWPAVSDEQRAANTQARRLLAQESD